MCLSLPFADEDVGDAGRLQLHHRDGYLSGSLSVPMNSHNDQSSDAVQMAVLVIDDTISRHAFEMAGGSRVARIVARIYTSSRLHRRHTTFIRPHAAGETKFPQDM